MVGKDPTGEAHANAREKAEPRGRDPGFTMDATLVAGVGFEPTTFGL